MGYEDENVIKDTIFTISLISDGDDDQIQEIIKLGILKKIFDLLDRDDEIQLTSLRVIGNILTGTNEQTQMLINIGILKKLYKILDSPKKMLRREACWAVSNIAAGNKNHIQDLIDAKLIKKIIKRTEDREYEIKKEAAYALCNSMTTCSKKQLKHMVKKGVIPALSNLLNQQDTILIEVSLQSFKILLAKGQMIAQKFGLEENPYKHEIEKTKGLSKIEELQEHSNNDIYLLCVEILEDYFNALEDTTYEPITKMDDNTSYVF